MSNNSWSAVPGESRNHTSIFHLQALGSFCLTWASITSFECWPIIARVSTSFVIVVVIVASITGIISVTRRLGLARLTWLLLGWLLLGGLTWVWSLQWLCHNLIHLDVIIFHGLLKKEVCGVFLIFITGEVSLGSLTLRKSKTLKALNCFHFLRSYSHSTGWLLSWSPSVSTKASTRKLVCPSGSSITASTTCHN